MDFNFSNLGQQNFSSNATAHLKPYEIYKVNLTKIEKGELKGTKDPNAVYPIVTLEFTSTEDKGTFSENLFIPTKEEDMVRPTFKNNAGHEYNRPSRFENFQFTLMQIVHALNPKLPSVKVAECVNQRCTPSTQRLNFCAGEYYARRVFVKKGIVK